MNTDCSLTRRSLATDKPGTPFFKEPTLPPENHCANIRGLNQLHPKHSLPLCPRRHINS